MLVDRTATLHKVMDLRNLLDRLHKQALRIKTKAEGMALSKVTRILRESKAFRGECAHPRAIIDGYDPNTNQLVTLDESAHIYAYLLAFERVNRKAMGRYDRKAFHMVRGLFQEFSTNMTANDYYKEYM